MSEIPKYCPTCGAVLKSWEEEIPKTKLLELGGFARFDPVTGKEKKYTITACEKANIIKHPMLHISTVTIFETHYFKALLS